MSQLWNMFNTLQILMILPMFALIMPANVLMVQDVVTGIINFQVIDKDKVYENYISPMFGT